MNTSKTLGLTSTLAVVGLLVFSLVGTPGASSGAARPVPIAEQVWEATADGDPAEVLVLLGEQADLRGAEDLRDREAKTRFVYEALRETALRSQAGLRRDLDRAGVAYRSFYVVNAIALGADRELLSSLAARPEVERIVGNPRVHQDLPQPTEGALGAEAVEGIEWNVLRVRADDLWAQGFTGQGIVVAGQDTGYDWDHPALMDQYRGYDGVTVTHDYNWHDAIHTTGSDCGADSPVPCDDSRHGTHTMGTIVGNDGAGNQIGVAPGAQWIGCRNMDEGWGTPASYMECFEFFLAPYPVGGDPLTDGEPALAPHVINNSWTCPPREGCEPLTLQTVVENVRAAGIMVVASAGNSGSSCGTVKDPPAIYDASFSVGATNSGDGIASFSSRGPVTVDGSGRRKPDISAPGASVRSCVPGGGYDRMSGTSMAGPHVAGAAALLWSAAPQLRGDVDATEWVLERSARAQTTSQSCGGDGPTDVPNHVYGWGIVDALAAVQKTEIGLSVAATPDPVSAGALVTHTFRVTNTGTETVNLEITAVLPPQVVPSGTVTWTASGLGTGAVWTDTVVATVADGYEGPLTSALRVSGAGVVGSAAYTSTSEAIVPNLSLSKDAAVWSRMLETYVTYTLSLTNTGAVPTVGAVLSDAIPSGTELAAATEPYVSDGSVVTWTLPGLLPGKMLSRTLGVSVVDVPTGGRVSNEAYGARAPGMLTPTVGSSVEVWVPWRVLILPVFKNWSGGGS